MVTDKIENLGGYPQLERYQKEIGEFIKALDIQELEEGRYVLGEDALTAPIQKYHTRDEDSSRMESHKKYAGLQYIRKGEGMIHMDYVEELVLVGSHTPGKNILFYKPRRDSGTDALKSGVFGYYEPQDAHMPCTTYLNSRDVVRTMLKTKMI